MNLSKYCQIDRFLFLFNRQQLADTGRKQLEQLLHQLQEQLQINLLQQTHLFQQQHNASKENSGMFCIFTSLSR